VEFDVQPIYGWGWSLGERQFAVPAPFRLKTVVNGGRKFKTAIGRFHNPEHPLSGMWIVLSPIQATNTWARCHLCAFPIEPTIPADLKTLVESAPLTGFAKVFALKPPSRLKRLAQWVLKQ
jgi:hypothetical protein